jgi:hypothetical protein
MIMRGRTLVADEGALVEDVAPEGWPDHIELSSGPRRPLADLLRWKDMVTARVSAADGAPDPVPEDVAWLVPALEDTRFRDAALVALLPAGEPLARRLARGTPTAGPALGACEERSPDADVFEAARVLLAAVARGAPPGRRAEALAALAWMSWWQGAGARSRLLAALALHDRPGHRLAGLVDTLLLHGVPPTWVPVGDMIEGEAVDGEDEGGLPGQGCGRRRG